MNIEEKFSKEGLLAHIKHIKEYVNDNRCGDVASNAYDAIKKFGDIYNKLSDDLINSIASYSNDKKSNIVGFVAKDGTFVKYDRENRDYVVYNNSNKKTVTMFKVSEQTYRNKLRNNYSEELPENQNNDANNTVEVDEIDDDSQKLIDSFLKK